MVLGCANWLAHLLSSPAAYSSWLCSTQRSRQQKQQQQKLTFEKINELSRHLLFSPMLLSTVLLLLLATAFKLAACSTAAEAAAPSSSSSSSSSSCPGEQSWARAMFIAVLVLHGFVQVNDTAASVPAAAAAGSLKMLQLPLSSATSLAA
jgi:hypothetical protein